MASLLARSPGPLVRCNVAAAASGRLAIADARRVPHLRSKIRVARDASGRADRIKATKAKIQQPNKALEQPADGRSPRRRNMAGAEFIERGGKKEAFAASLIALPCAVVFSMWTWAKWYEEEHHDNLSHREPNEGLFKLLGITSHREPKEELFKLLGITTTPPPLLNWESMVKHFTVVPAMLIRGDQSPYVLVTSAFSHMDGTHLAANMLGLYVCSIDVPLPSRLGALRFLTLFLGSAFVGSLASFGTLAALALREDRNYLMAKSLGASGGVNGLVTAAVLWRSKAMVIPAWGYLACTVGYDAWGLAEQMTTTARGEGPQTGHGAHLGGAAVGAAAFAFWRKTLLKF